LHETLDAKQLQVIIEETSKMRTGPL